MKTTKICVIGLLVISFITAVVMLRDTRLDDFTKNFSGLTDDLVTELKKKPAPEIDEALKILDQRKELLRRQYQAIALKVEDGSLEAEKLKTNLEINGAKFKEAFILGIANDEALKKNPEIKSKYEKLLNDYDALTFLDE